MTPRPTDLARRITSALSDIAKYWESSLTESETHERMTRSVPTSTAPGDLDGISQRHAAAECLTELVTSVLRERRLHSAMSTLDIPRMCDFLTTQADWLAIYDGERTHRQLTRHARTLRELVTGKPKRIYIGDCPTCDDGRLHATIRTDDPDQLGDTIDCDTCPTTWTPFEWRALWRTQRTRYGPTRQRSQHGSRHAHLPASA